MMDKRLEIVERLKSLEAYLCGGKRTKRECREALGYPSVSYTHLTLPTNREV